MSMLAERKRKQKWSLNPRGKEWSEDANKFGQKMLEKMGWQSGRGLGLKENGITEHIKVSFKNDSRGMGYKETNDQWTEHETNFSALLESLTGEEKVEENLKVSSLEKKSQTSRARVHYHKFTRGKDLSRYSEKDLANIFGRKSLQKAKKEEIKTEIGSDSKDGENGNDNLVNGGSMMDYFKKKLPIFGKTNGYTVGNNGVLQKQEYESETETRTSFGFGFNADNKNSESESEARPSFGLGFNSTETGSKPSFVSYISDNQSNKRPAEDIEDTVLSPKKKSKKSKQKIEENNGISNPAFNPMSTPVKIQKHVLNTIEESITEDINESLDKSEEVQESPANCRKKKKIKDKVEVNPIEEISTKVKKKKDKNVSVDNPMFDDTEDISINVTQIEENPFEVPCKKIKKKKAGKSVDNPIFDATEDTFTNLQEVEENPYEVKVKKTKKSKKFEIINPNFDNTEDTSIDESQVVENPYEVKPTEKKKKKKDKAALRDHTFEDNLESIYSNEVKPKKKKKKKEENGIANPALDLNDTKNEESTIIEDYDLMLNIVSTPVQKEQPTTSSVGSASRVESVKSRKSVRFSNTTQELIIPNNDDLKILKEMYGKKSKSKKKNKGLDNINFDEQQTNLDENIDTIAKTLDNYQAEMENDINEGKIHTATVEDFMVGEIGNDHGENELTKDGTMLKFKYANIDTKTPFYMMDKVGARKSYKHLIKGDILLKFKNTNLHDIKGYGVKRTNVV